MKHAVWIKFVTVAVLALSFAGFSPAAHADLASIFTNVPPGTGTATPRRTSIILIQCEGLGLGDLSCYGQTNFQTPNIDRLAAEGMRFTNYYAGSSAASPGRASLLTGMDSRHLPQRVDTDLPLGPDQTTVAQVLRTSGYKTDLVGEWLFGDENSASAPWMKGFDSFSGYFDPAAAANFYCDYVWRYAPSALYNPTNKTWSNFVGHEMIYDNTKPEKTVFIPQLFASAVVNFVRGHEPDRYNQFQPVFVMAHFKLPGNPKTLNLPTDAPYSEEHWTSSDKTRAAAVSRLDDYVGQILDGLAKLKASNNIAIFLTSDTGPLATNRFEQAMGLRGQGGELYEGALRVPLIVRCPTRVAAGKINGLPCAACDILPTLADLAFTKTPPNLDGISFLPTLTGETQTARHQGLFWELHGTNIMKAAYVEGWKAVLPADGPLEIYDLKSDPAEKTPLQNADMTAEFTELLKPKS